MKKFFALALAAAMIASMSAVSFAAVGTIANGTAEKYTVKVDGNDIYYPIANAVGPLSYDKDEKEIGNDTIEYGDTAYYALLQFKSEDALTEDEDDGKEIYAKDYDEYQLVSDSEVVSSLKVKADWEEGKDLVKNVSIVKKKVTNDDAQAILDSGADYSYTQNDYYYFLAIATESSTSVTDADIIGTLTFNKSKDPKVDDLDMDLALNVGWENNYNSDEDLEVTGDVGPLEAEEYYAMKFNCDDEVDIEFEDDSIFTVDVSGQSKLLVYYDTDYNSKIANKYPLADFNFWNGNGAKFNRVGEMFLSCDSDYAQFLYQVNSDGTLSEVPGAEYDEYDEGFYFNTRVLGTYVISDMELDLEEDEVEAPVVEAPVTTTPAPVVSNPSTGAIA